MGSPSESCFTGRINEKCSPVLLFDLNFEPVLPKLPENCVTKKEDGTYQLCDALYANAAKCLASINAGGKRQDAWVKELPSVTLPYFLLAKRIQAKIDESTSTTIDWNVVRDILDAAYVAGFTNPKFFTETLNMMNGALDDTKNGEAVLQKLTDEVGLLAKEIDNKGLCLGNPNGRIKLGYLIKLSAKFDPKAKVESVIDPEKLVTDYLKDVQRLI